MTLSHSLRLPSGAARHPRQPLETHQSWTRVLRRGERAEWFNRYAVVMAEATTADRAHAAKTQPNVPYHRYRHTRHSGNDTQCHELHVQSAVLTIEAALGVALRSETVKGFTYNHKTSRAYFHWRILPQKIVSLSHHLPGQRNYTWHSLYIKSQ